MDEVTTKDKGVQIAGILLLLSVVFAVLYFAGSFDLVADHVSMARDFANEKTAGVTGYFSELFAQAETPADVEGAAGQAETIVQ